MSQFDTVKLTDLVPNYAENHQYPPENRLNLEFRSGDWGRYHRHYGRDESLLIIDGDGECDIVGINGISRIPLGGYDSDRPFFCRVRQNVYHRMKIDGWAQKVMAGPEFVSLQPTFLDAEPALPVTYGTSAVRMLRTNEEAFYLSDEIVTVSRTEIERLKAEVNQTSRKRIRLCVHPNGEDRIHEMFVVYTNQTYIQPNKHAAKDETFHILEGEADFIFYTESGDIREIIPLGDKNSGKAFYVRVPAGVYHSVIMHSNIMVIHESTPGPYDRSHTIWAPWAKSQGSRQ